MCFSILLERFIAYKAYNLQPEGLKRDSVILHSWKIRRWNRKTHSLYAGRLELTSFLYFSLI